MKDLIIQRKITDYKQDSLSVTNEYKKAEAIKLGAVELKAGQIYQKLPQPKISDYFVDNPELAVVVLEPNYVIYVRKPMK